MSVSVQQRCSRVRATRPELFACDHRVTCKDLWGHLREAPSTTAVFDRCTDHELGLALTIASCKKPASGLHQGKHLFSRDHSICGKKDVACINTKVHHMANLAMPWRLYVKATRPVTVRIGVADDVIAGFPSWFTECQQRRRPHGCWCCPGL